MAASAVVSSCSSNNFTINELLAYINYYRKRYPLDNLKIVVINFYSLEEISDAKAFYLFCAKITWAINQVEEVRLRALFKRLTLLIYLMPS